MHNVFVVEDQVTMREVLIEFLSMEQGLDVCGQASTYEEAVEKLSETPTDLVLIDVSLPRASGIDLVRALRASHPTLRTLVVSGHVEEIYAQQAFEAGADGYVLKDDVVRHLVPAIRTVLGGGSYVSERMVT